MIYGGNRLARFAAWPLLIAGGFLAGLLALGPVEAFGMELSLITQSVGAFLLICGLTLLYGDWAFELLHPYDQRFRRRALRLLSYDWIMGAVTVLFFGGCAMLARYFIRGGGNIADAHVAVTGLLAMAVAVITFIFALIGLIIRKQEEVALRRSESAKHS